MNHSMRQGKLRHKALQTPAQGQEAREGVRVQVGLDK